MRALNTKISHIMNVANMTILTALTLSTVAAWFAITGLIAIFPAKATAIAIMGGVIECAKVISVIWLRKYWSVASWQLKTMIIPMIIIAMMLTSLGTFGYLSSAHSQQSIQSGDVMASVAILDEKIKTQRENIEVARRALAQLDAQVNARLERGTSETSAERAITIRRQQTSERNLLLREISESQALIAKLNEERAPLTSQLRKVEAEIGPVKYIAALIYGENPDDASLERAVRWVIIMLVMVFDPFAIALVLAGNTSRKWEGQHGTAHNTIVNMEPKVETQTSTDNAEFDIKKHTYLLKGGFGFKNDVPIQVYKEETHTETDVNENKTSIKIWGTSLPVTGTLGEIFVLVKSAPYQVYKWNGDDWMIIDTTKSSPHMSNDEYMRYLISQLVAGKYDVDLLTDLEKEDIRIYLKTVANGENIMRRTVG